MVKVLCSKDVQTDYRHVLTRWWRWWHWRRVPRCGVRVVIDVEPVVIVTDAKKRRETTVMRHEV